MRKLSKGDRLKVLTLLPASVVFLLGAWSHLVPANAPASFTNLFSEILVMFALYFLLVSMLIITGKTNRRMYGLALSCTTALFSGLMALLIFYPTFNSIAIPIAQLTYMALGKLTFAEAAVIVVGYEVLLFFLTYQMGRAICRVLL